MVKSLFFFLCLSLTNAIAGPRLYLKETRNILVYRQDQTTVVEGYVDRLVYARSVDSSKVLVVFKEQGNVLDPVFVDSQDSVTIQLLSAAAGGTKKVQVTTRPTLIRQNNEDTSASEVIQVVLSGQ